MNEIAIPEGGFEDAIRRERLVSLVAYQIEDEIHDLSFGINCTTLFEAGSICQPLDRFSYGAEPIKPGLYQKRCIHAACILSRTMWERLGIHSTIRARLPS